MVVGADQDERPHQIRALQRDQQGNDPAVAVSDEVRAAAADLLEDADRLAGHVVVVERGIGIRGAPVPAPVEGDEAVLGSEVGEHPEKAVAVGEAAVEEQHRLSLTVRIDPRRMAADRNVLTHDDLPTIT